MIKFFRKIRHQLLTEKKMQKYLLYAIGEIALVMIGILLALQVNNWNEHKTNLNQASNHLATIKLNIEDDIKQVEKLLAITETKIEYSNTFLDQFKTLIPVDDNIQMYIISLMLENNIEVNKSGIDVLINSNGMNYIDENLQVKILNYYRHLEQLMRREENSNTEIKAMYEPYIKEKYNWIYNKTNPWPRQANFYKDDPRTIEKFNKKSLLGDKQLEVFVYGRRWQSMNLQELYSKTIVLAQELISDINNYEGEYLEMK
jgi:hypothetical protein